MKVVACIGIKNKIRWVKSFDWYKEHKDWSPKQVENAVSKGNEDANGEYTFEIWEVDGVIANLVEFLLGDKKYKIYSDIDDLDDSINELSGDLDSMRDDIFHMSQSMENIENMFKDFKEKLTKKGYYRV